MNYFSHELFSFCLFVFFFFFFFLLFFLFLLSSHFSHHFFFSSSFLLIFSFAFLFLPIFGSPWSIRSREEASSPFPHAICVALIFFLISLFLFMTSYPFSTGITILPFFENSDFLGFHMISLLWSLLTTS